MLISQELLVQFTSNLDRIQVGMCPATRWHCFYANDITGCAWVCKMHPRCFSGLKNTKNKERYNLECVDVLPECS